MDIWYLALLALCAGFLFAVPLGAWLERRALAREKEAYERFVGTDPWSRKV